MLRSLVLIAAALLFLATQPVWTLPQHHGMNAWPETTRPVFPAGQIMVEVPFHDDNGSVIVDIRINGSDPIPFILDTGTPPSLLTDPGRVEGLSSSGMASDLRFEIGAMSFEGVGLVVEQLAILDGIDGLLVLVSYGFTLEYEPLPIRVAHETRLQGMHLQEVQFEFPDTPAGSAAKDWFAAMESGERDVLIRFFEKRMYIDEDPYDPAGDLAQHGVVFRDTGGVRPHSIMRSDAYEIVVLGAGKNGNWVRVTLGVQASPPHRIILFSVRKSQGPEAEAGAVSLIRPQLQRSIASAAATLLRDQYVFADVGKTYGDALDEELALLDEPMTAEALATRLTRLLRQVQLDNHLAILDPTQADRVFMMYGEPEPASDGELEAEPQHESDEGPEPAAEGHAGMLDQGDGFGQVVVGADGIALVEMSRFVWDAMAQARGKEVMSSIQDAEALVFDLRGNGGGDGDMVDLIESYLFAEPTHIMSSVRRAKDGSETTVESWTTTNSLSSKMAKIPVFILIDVVTGSAAEAFAFGLKHADRATVIGQTSAGAGHRVTYERLPGGFGIGVPIGAAVNPATGRGWEGVGVIPDVETTPGASLEALLSIVRDQVRTLR